MILDKFPMPPTSNNLYASFRGRLIKSAAGREFDKKALHYKLMNGRKIGEIKKEIALRSGIGPICLHVDTQFVFFRNRIVDKAGQMKRCDSSNRLKSCHDALASILGIDDCFFVSGSFSKAVTTTSATEYVKITISFTELKTVE